MSAQTFVELLRAHDRAWTDRSRPLAERAAMCREIWRGAIVAARKPAVATGAAQVTAGGAR